jgi:hypothetical protein
MKKMNLLLIASFILSYLNYAQEAPNIAITDIKGDRHQLYHALDQGFIVMLNFSFLDCVPCNEALPEIKSIVEDFEEQNLLVWYASDRDNDLELNEFLINNGLDAIAAGPFGGVEEAIDEFDEVFSFFGFPTISVICPDRSIMWDIWPYSEGAPEWRSAIENCQPNVPDAAYEPIEPSSSNHTITNQQIDARLYPVPMENQGILEIELPRKTYVYARIFSTSGRMEKVLLDQYLPEGAQQIAVQADELNTGIYILHLQYDNLHGFMKLIVQK